MKPHIFQTIVGFGTMAMAASAINKQCPMPNSCFSLNIPDASASSGNDVFLQITGPTSNSWVAMGTGTEMSGSTMLVIYASSNGNNITLSGRKGNDHEPPAYSQDVKATLLDGSGISNGIMTANIKCSNCGKEQADWIYGAYKGSPINSDSPTHSIHKHTDMYGTFRFNIASAKGGSSTNPFFSGGDNHTPTQGGNGAPQGGTHPQSNEGSGSQSNKKGGSGGSGSPAVQTGGANRANITSFTLSSLPTLLSLLSLLYSSRLMPSA